MKPERQSTEPLYLTVAGSGIGIYKCEADGKYDILASPFVAGPSIICLAKFITGVSDFNTLVEMARKGNRFKCDLSVCDSSEK